MLELSSALMHADKEGNLVASVLVTCIRVVQLSSAHERWLETRKKSEATFTKPLLWKSKVGGGVLSRADAAGWEQAGVAVDAAVWPAGVYHRALQEADGRGLADQPAALLQHQRGFPLRRPTGGLPGPREFLSIHSTRDTSPCLCCSACSQSVLRTLYTLKGLMWSGSFPARTVGQVARAQQLEMCDSKLHRQVVKGPAPARPGI